MNQYGRQSLGDDEAKAVLKTLRSDFLTQGPTVEVFEQQIAHTVGARFATACSSGTAGLHLAMLALGIRSGDVVWTTPITFVASANAAMYLGANVELVDIDPNTWNLSPAALEKKIKANLEQKKPLPKALVIVHFAGTPAELAKIKELTRPLNILIIEDAAHAFGASTPEEKIGSCKYSDVSVFSFHPVKNITTGEGGCITTNSSEIDAKLKTYRTHGITKNKNFEGEPWRYDQVTLGYNYRLTDLQASIGIVQLKKIHEFVNKRHELFFRYLERLQSNPEISFQDLGNNVSAHHLMVIRVPKNKRRLLFSSLKAKGVGVQVHYLPLYEHSYYKAKKIGDAYSFPNSDSYYSEALTLPLHTELELFEVDKISKSVLEVVRD